MNLEEHWNSIFNKTDDNKLGWWENETSQTLKFIENININSSTNIFLAGAGTSVLVDELIKKDCNLILNDISFIALEKLKLRLKNSSKLDFFQYDLSKPFVKENIDIWIDRAVLHFLLKEKDIEIYFENLNKNLRIGSFALFAQFKIGGATSCASLEIKQYDIYELSKRLGENFELILSEDYDFINPFGNKKEYVYALYKRVK
jgi:EEF1A lysine methyltransferase 2